MLSLWDGTNAASQQLLSISLNYSLTNSISSFIEYYLNIGETLDSAHAMDFGFSYMLFKNLQLDVSGGFGLNAKALDSGLGFGIALAI
jgi:predicted porin